MKLILNVGDVVKLDGVLREVISVNPHQERPDSVYYDFGEGYEERDIRLHPEAVYRKDENFLL